MNYSISKTAPNGFWHRLERGDIPLDDKFYAGFNQDLHGPARWQAFYKAQQAKNPSLPRSVPQMPAINGELLFNEIMKHSADPDPWMMPALRKLKADGGYILMALSNTILFPRGHSLFQEDFFNGSVTGMFDCFVSSAHVGMRKPEVRMYIFALHRAARYAKDNADSERGRRNGWQDGVALSDFVFLDDIGENLRAARELGFRTIKVPLGRAYEAVDELERITGLSLAGDHPRVPIRPRASGSTAKI